MCPHRGFQVQEQFAVQVRSVAIPVLQQGDEMRPPELLARRPPAEPGRGITHQRLGLGTEQLPAVTEDEAHCLA